MSRHTLFFVTVTAFLLVAGSVFAVPPWELEAPVFVGDYPNTLRGSHCDDSVVWQFEAYIPNQPHAQGRIRYRLVDGCGKIDPKTGRWVWYPEASDTLQPCLLTVAAYINNQDVETAPEMYARVAVLYRDDRPRLRWAEPWRPRQPEFFHVEAPGVNVIGYTIRDRDWCDTPRVSIVEISPTPFGVIEFGDTALVADLVAADSGRKYVVAYEVSSGPAFYRSHVVLDTRGPVVPVFVECPEETLFVAVCGEISYQLRAVDPDWPDLPAGISYRLIRTSNGGGYVNHRTGEYHFRPRSEEAARLYEIEVAAYYGDTMTTGEENCRFWVQVGENSPPEFVNSPCSMLTVAPPGADGYFHAELYASDPDGCGLMMMFLDEVSPTPAGGVGFLTTGYPDVYGEFSMRIAEEQFGEEFSIRVGATDGKDTVYCEFGYVHQVREPLEVVIERTHMSYSGSHEYVDITVNRNSMDLQGFNLLLGYDARSLSFQMASAGSIYDSCGWEYFTYRYGPVDGCEGCPSGVLRLVGIAETNNGEVHPSCFSPETPFTLATLDFLVTSDREYECAFLPIRFLWADCGDNEITAIHPMQMPLDFDLLISREVYEFDSALVEAGVDSLVQITDLEGTLPGYGGAPRGCEADTDPYNPQPIRLVDFRNGGVAVTCADSIDTFCGTGWPSITDAVLYSNSFVYGESVFTDSSYYHHCLDVNGDGVYPSIEDFVYLVRNLTGDAVQLDSLTDTVAAEFTISEGTVAVMPNEPLGAAFFRFADSVAPNLLAEGMEMKCAYDPVAMETRCLVYSFDTGRAIDTGEVVSIPLWSVLVQVEAATYEGGPVHEKFPIPTGVDDEDPNLPRDFAVHQNHPNPFNLETVIPFDLPKAGVVTFEVYNALGQVVYGSVGEYSAGRHRIVWDGRTNSGKVAASGVYFYHIEAAGSSETKKMLLLK